MSLDKFQVYLYGIELSRLHSREEIYEEISLVQCLGRANCHLERCQFDCEVLNGTSYSGYGREDRRDFGNLLEKLEKKDVRYS